MTSKTRMARVAGITLASVGFGMAATWTVAADNTNGPDDQVATIDLIVSFHEQPEAAEVDWIEQTLGGAVSHVYHLIPAMAVTIPVDRMDDLRGHPSFKYVDEDHVRHINAEEDAAWGVRHIGGIMAHNLGYDGGGARVGVLDTGIDYRHPELAAVYAGGFDFVFNDADPLDDHDHGSHVSGTIAAAMDGAGVVGMAPNVEIYAAKAFNALGSGSDSDIIAAVEFLTDLDLDVVNHSWGGFSPSQAMRDVFQASFNAGVINVCASGNYGTLFGVSYPASFNNTYAVAATDINNARAGFSSTGPQVDLAAPGVDVLSSVRNGGYAEFSGTSMATPHVVGAVALLIGSGQMTDDNNNGTLFDEIKVRLASTAIDLGAEGKDNNFGYGLLNAQAALVEPMGMVTDGLVAGTESSVQISGGTPGNTVRLFYSSLGPGYSPSHAFNVILGIRNPIVAGVATVDGDGNASFSGMVPGGTSGLSIWLQAVEDSTNSSLVMKQVIN